jgi:DeoR family glycerol-3-phosphate regulon repressor
MEVSRTKFVSADHSKFNAEAMMPIAHISEIDSLFTDEMPPELILNSIKKHSTNLFVGSKKI